MTGRRPALVLDFGGPVLLTPFELTGVTEARAGLPPGRLHWTGPFAPQDDPQWQQWQAGQLSERGYWARRAADWPPHRRAGDTSRSLMDAVFAGSPETLLRPGAVALMRDARAAGIPVGVLTNDMRAFHSQEWIDRLELGQLTDSVVDGSVEGILKPDPRIYQLAAGRLGVRCEDVVFIDDQPANLAGATGVGMTAVPADVTRPAGCFARARELLGLPAA